MPALRRPFAERHIAAFFDIGAGSTWTSGQPPLTSPFGTLAGAGTSNRVAEGPVDFDLAAATIELTGSRC
jgi:hypothetical protein